MCFGAKGATAPFVVYGDGASPARCRLNSLAKDAASEPETKQVFRCGAGSGGPSVTGVGGPG